MLIFGFKRNKTSNNHKKLKSNLFEVTSDGKPTASQRVYASGTLTKGGAPGKVYRKSHGLGDIYEQAGQTSNCSVMKTVDILHGIVHTF